MKPFLIHTARTLHGARHTLLNAAGGAAIIAGGADLLGEMKEGIAAPATLVDINMLRLDEMDAGADGAAASIGGAVTLARIAADDEMLKLCETKPSGDVRLMYATVRSENRDAFRRAVRQRLGGDFLTLDMSEVEAMRLLGPEPRSTETRIRTGNTLALSINNAVIDLRKALGEDSAKRMRSHHSGLTPAEMRIPLVIA